MHRRQPRLKMQEWARIPEGAVWEDPGENKKYPHDLFLRDPSWSWADVARCSACKKPMPVTPGDWWVTAATGSIQADNTPPTLLKIMHKECMAVRSLIDQVPGPHTVQAKWGIEELDAIDKDIAEAMSNKIMAEIEAEVVAELEARKATGSKPDPS